MNNHALKQGNVFTFIDVNVMLNYCTNYFLHKYHKKEIANNEDCWKLSATGSLILEIAPEKYVRLYWSYE